MTTSFPGVLTRASFSLGAARSRAGANFGLGPTKIRAPHEQRQRAEHGLPGENQHGAMVPSAHHASPTACVAGSSPPSTCPACPQPSGDPRPCIPRLSMAVVRHACSRSLSSFCAGYGIVAHRDDHLPQPCCRSDILDLLSVPEPVCRHGRELLVCVLPVPAASSHVLTVRPRFGVA